MSMATYFRDLNLNMVAGAGRALASGIAKSAPEWRGAAASIKNTVKSGNINPLFKFMRSGPGGNAFRQAKSLSQGWANGMIGTNRSSSINGIRSMLPTSAASNIARQNLRKTTAYGLSAAAGAGVGLSIYNNRHRNY